MNKNRTLLSSLISFAVLLTLASCNTNEEEKPEDLSLTTGEQIVQWLSENIDLSSTPEDWDGFVYQNGSIEKVSEKYKDSALMDSLDEDGLIVSSGSQWTLGKRNGYTYGYYDYINEYKLYNIKTTQNYFFEDGVEYQISSYDDEVVETTTSDAHGIVETYNNYEYYLTRLIYYSWYGFKYAYGDEEDTLFKPSYYDNWESDGATISTSYNEDSLGNKECIIDFFFDYPSWYGEDTIKEWESNGFNEDWDNLYFTFQVKLTADNNDQITGYYYTKHNDLDTFYTSSDNGDYVGYSERTYVDYFYKIDPNTIEEPEWISAYKEGKES